MLNDLDLWPEEEPRFKSFYDYERPADDQYISYADGTLDRPSLWYTGALFDPFGQESESISDMTTQENESRDLTPSSESEEPAISAVPPTPSEETPEPVDSPNDMSRRMIHRRVVETVSRKPYDAPPGVWKTPTGAFISTIYIANKRFYGPVRYNMFEAAEDREILEQFKMKNPKDTDKVQKLIKNMKRRADEQLESPPSKIRR